MKKKSIQRIAAWLLAAGMMAGTFAQPMAVYAESTASIAASDSTTGDSITADADVVIATPTPEPDTGTDTAATPVPTADSQTPQDPASTAAPETTPAPDAAEDVPTPTPTPTPTPAAEDTADDAADTDDTTDTTTTVTPADLQSCIALLAASQLSLDADSIEPDVREEITETEPSTLQAVVNAAVFAAPAGQTDIVVDVPAGNYTGTLVIPDATIVGKDANGNEININYTNKNIVLNMTGSTLTVPTDAAVGVSVFGSLTIRGGTIKAADGCTATRGVQVQLGSALTLDSTTISDFTYAGPGAGVYVKGTAAVDTNGQFDVALGKNQEPLQNADNTYQFKKLQRENGNSMDTSFTMKGGTTITNCKSDGNGAALYVHNAALLTLENANFTTNNAGGFGGAVYLGTGVQTTIGDGVTFTGNHAAKDGGALYLANQYTLHVKADNILVQVPVTFNGGTFTDNSTDTYALLTDSDKETVQQSNDTYNNIYFARAGGKNNALLTSPTASIKVRSRSISGLVWMDQNYDGIYTTKLDDTGKKNVGSDKTLAGITVTLVQTKPNTKDENPVCTDGNDISYYAVTDTLGNKVQPVTTKKDGRYTFGNLKQGNYRVLFTDSKDGYMMEDDSKPVLPFGKLSVTKHDAMGDSSNKTDPQYGTEDANTLQAAMSGEITLGDAVLTGRDDKTNINAGFYYTELRLAKVWQNIPDAKKAAEAKVDFTLAASQDENELEEAVYTLSNTAVSKPAKADENAENLTLFGTFVGDKVDVTDDSAERTVRWQTTQGLPLQAENAKGPITYTLKQDTVRADGDTWIGNVSFVQQQVTEKVSSGAESDNSVIATRLVAVNTARTYEILIHKLSNVENKELEQAEFTATLQPASPLEKLLGGKVEIKSQQTIQRTGENEETEEIRYRLTDLTAGTYTLAETKAPLGYAKDPVKYKLTITDRNENCNTLPTIALEDDKGNLLYTAEMTKAEEGEELYTITVKEGETRKGSTASAVMTAGSCLETMPKNEQEQSNLPIRTQISMEITDSYFFSLPFTGGSGMNRSLLQGVAVMALAAAAFAVTAIHRKKKNHS